MDPLVSAQVNGHVPSSGAGHKRFSDIPSAIDIPVSGAADAEEAVELNLEELLDDSTELCQLLDAENASKNLWMTISLAYAKQHMIDHAISILTSGLQTLSRAGLSKEKIGLLSLQCWLYLWKSREAPRVLPDGALASEVKTKEFYLQAATGALNDASRVNPAFPPLFLARGILSLLRASLLPPSKPPQSKGTTEQSERVNTLRQALKCFEDAMRVSGGRNMMAVLGRARAYFSLGEYSRALECYQTVLAKMPDLQDPDPRIGIGCCLWQLTHIEEAKEAWERALEINPQSKIASVLVGLYYLKNTSSLEVGSPEYKQRYRKALGTYAKNALQLDSEHPLTCATLGRYFLTRHDSEAIENFARKAIELTDVNAVASDGWYLLASKEHYQPNPNLTKVFDFYNRADNARGGGEKGFLPAKFGAVQAQVLNKNVDDAKFRLEKIIPSATNCFEAKILLGTIYAQEVFENQASGAKEDKSVELKKAISYLDTVRLAWRDPKKAIEPDMDVLLTLARLYETEHPDKSLQCLLQLRQFALDNLDPDFQYPEIEDKDTRIAKKMEHLPPQLLNNIACLQYQLEKFTQATETFQRALNAYVNHEKKEGSLKSDQLVTTISYNLARSYEASGILEEARPVYEEILARHPDYIDARIRLSYIELRQNSLPEGFKAMAALNEADPTNMEVRSLYGWYLSKNKKRASNIAEDQEQRHYKHTLQNYDKHDQYSLTGMGNLYLTMAREMRRETEQEKEKRRKTYEKAVEFYQKALQLDPRNAYAAQGIGIALVEDRKDFPGAIQIFSKIKDTIKESCVLINLGHAYGELKQFAKAIEHYEAAVARDRADDPQILACLGRVWLLRGKAEKSVTAMKTSLEYSRRALEVNPNPEQVHFKFNIAFVQFQLAQTMVSINEAQRTLVDVEAAAIGLDEAIESFAEIAKVKNPPYPRHDLEQRANMGRNTIRKQLERAVQAQRDFEQTHAAKLAQARELRDAELRAKDERKRQEEAEAAEKKRKLQEERQKLIDRSRELAEKRAEDERQREEAEYTQDSEGEKVKRKRRPKATGKRKKKGEDGSGDESSAGDSSAPAPRRKPRTKNTTVGSGADSDEESRAPRKKRKLARKSEKVNSKFKSSELIVDSDEEAGLENGAFEGSGRSRQGTLDQEDTEMRDASEENTVSKARKKGSRKARVIESDDEDEENEPGTNGHAVPERVGGAGSDSDMT